MKILVYPKDANPYQELLYQPSLKMDDNWTISYIKRYPLIDALHFPLIIFVRRLQGYKLIHIHWPVFAVKLPFLPFQKQISYAFFLLCVWWMKFLDFRIVWTVHNVLPHEPQTNDDLKLMRYFSNIVNAKIVHSGVTLKDMKKLGLSTKNSHVIPIGSYANLYPNTWNRSLARKKLGIHNDEFVILFFGLIRRYKGVAELIEAFKSVHLPNTRLLIVGQCLDRGLKKMIEQAKRDIAIDFYDAFIPDDEVATYFQACNVVCLPFKEVTTSSSVLLAMAFGRPIIVPRLGALVDLPSNVGYLYDPALPNVLEEALMRAIHNKSQLKKLGANGKKYSDSLSWDKIAEQTYRVYQDVLSETVKDKS